ncbi:MAG TPA: hypothetical protein VKT74_02570 [Gammaproteobacteria bacterium]|nr:hypothetical protein [Gammaproteobacteria bacterium]
MRRFLLPLILLALLLPAVAQAACADLVYKQFDFWLGDWNVTDAAGKLIGRDNVAHAFGGCVVQEQWTSVDGGTGGSFTMYDVSRKLWHQTWVDSSGTLVVLEGGLKDGRMLLTGQQVDRDGKPKQTRMSWSQEDGKVRQIWEASADGGKTWKTIFEAVYSRAN